MRVRTTPETIKKVEKIVRTALEERFGDEFVFDPIIVEPWFGIDDEEFLHIYLFVDGDQKRLDPGWTGGLSGIILDQTTEDEVFTNPVKGFVEKSEWEEFLADQYRESTRPD